MARRSNHQLGDALSAGHALLRDDAAVFGFSHAAEAAPAWIEDDGEVGRRICAKVRDEIDADVWWRVAEVARLCRRVSGSSTDGGQRLQQVKLALRASRSVARDLPAPLPLACALPGHASPADEPRAALVVAGPRRDLVDSAGHRLAAALDEPGWIDPDALAGWVDDAVLALRAYGAGLLAVHG